MSAFVITAVLMLALCAFCIALTLLRKNQEKDRSAALLHDNIAAAKAQLGNLRRADEANIMDAGEIQTYQEEIQAQLLADTDTAAAAPPQKTGGGRIAAAAAVLFIVIAAPVLYVALGAPQHLQDAAVMRDITAQEEDLKQRLQQNANDAEALAMLGENMMTQQRYLEAARYYQRARQIVGDTPLLLVSHLEALAREDDAQLDEVLTTALEKIPDEPLVLWVAGLHARQRGDLSSARQYWQRLYDRLEGADMRQNVAAALAELETDTGAGGTPGGGVTVAVMLDSALQSKINAGMALFIFARGGGTPMPLAVKRYTSGELPLVAVLDDSAAMSPAAKMSDSDSYQIVARISQSGDAQARPGDFYGETAARRGENVSIVINQIVGAAPAIGTADTAAPAAVTVAVRLAAALEKQINGQQALFIFARGGGKPMPLAVKRYTSGELPLSVVLDDSAAMSPAAKMSDTDSYQIIARISQSGNAQAQPGDFYGEVTARRGENISIVINQIVQ